MEATVAVRFILKEEEKEKEKSTFLDLPKREEEKGKEEKPDAPSGKEQHNLFPLCFSLSSSKSNDSAVPLSPRLFSSGTFG